MEDRIADIEKHIRVINHELGVVMGKTSVIEKLVVGTLLSSSASLLAIVGKIGYDILIGG